MEEGPSRKRLRRDVKSCLECRRRKVKCQLTSEDVSACAACVKNGVTCSIETSGNAPSGPATTNSSPGLDREDRLGRIEQMLSMLIELQSARSVDILPFPTDLDHEESYNLSFNNDWTETSSKPEETFTNLDLCDSGTSAPVASPNLVGPGAYAQSTGSFLLSLFPCQQDLDIIAKETMAWAFGLADPPGNMLKAGDATTALNFVQIAKLPAAGIAQALLYLSLYIQQLPAEFDENKLQMAGCRDAVMTYCSHVSSLVLASGDEGHVVERLQCLLLLGMIYINEGDIRKAWISFRRAVDIAKTHDYHRSYSLANRHFMSEAAISQRRLWRSCVMGDGYTSLLLGLESGAGSQPFGSDQSWEDPAADTDANFERHLGILSARLSYINISMDESLAMENLLDRMDIDLDRLEASVPDSWWKPPDTHNERSIEGAQAYNRLICQQWFLQLRLLTHLRGALTNTGSELSRMNCLEASKATMQGYLGLRQSSISQMHCRCADIAVFVATVVIILARALSPGQVLPTHRYSAEFVLISQVIRLLENLGGKSPREHISKQGAVVLKVLLASCEVTPSPIQEYTPFTMTPSSSNEVFESEVVGEKARESHKLYDVLSSCFQNILGREHPASRLIDSAFSVAQQSARPGEKRKLRDVQDHSTDLNDFLNPDTINWDL